MHSMSRLWQGELSLHNAFWHWAVIGGLIINIASSVLFVFLITVDRPVAALIAGYALSVPYNIVATVGVWRSAGRYTGEPHWANLAKLATVAGMILLSVT